MAARVGGPGRRRRKYLYAAAAFVAHLALLGAMGLGLHNAGEMAGVPALDLDLTPVSPALFPARKPPAARAAAAKTPLEPSRTAAAAGPPAPPASSAAPVHPRIGAGPAGAPMGPPIGPVADNPAQAALRASSACDSAGYIVLSAAEVARCEARERRLRGKPHGTYAVIDPAKKDAFDGTCKRDDDWCLYYRGLGPYPGLMALIGKKK